MRGLIWKELYLAKTMGRSYALLLVMFAVLTLTGVYQGLDFFGFFFVMLLIMLPINTFAYDEQARWDKYAVSSPAGRKGVVASKYLFTAALGLVGMVVITLFQTAAWFLGEGVGETLAECVMGGVGTVCAGFILVAVLLPLIFKFGTQKSRVALMVAVGVGVGVSVAVLGLLTNLTTGQAAALQIMSGLLPILAVGLMVVSYFISQGIYGKKEL